MRNLITIIGAAFLMSACAFAGSAVTWVLSTGTNTTATGYEMFTGEIEDIAVYPSTGASGTVSIVALDPFSDDALVLGTNAMITAARIFVPRVVGAEDIGGAGARVVTNSATGDRFAAQGESIRATVNNASTGATFRVRIKVK